MYDDSCAVLILLVHIDNEVEARLPIEMNSRRMLYATCQFSISMSYNNYRFANISKIMSNKEKSRLNIAVYYEVPLAFQISLFTYDLSTVNVNVMHTLS